MALSRPKKKLTKSQRVCIAACLAGAFFLFNLVWVYPTRAQEITTAEQTGLTAESGFGQAALGKQDITATVAKIINIVLGVLGIIAVALIVYAGYMWMTAGGNAEKVEKAKLILRNAAIGLAIILASWGIAAFIISRLSGASGTGAGAGGGGGGPPGGGIGGERFTLKEFQTSRAGTQAGDDVYLCSNIQSRFNHWLSLQSVENARGLPQPALRLSVWQTAVLNEGNYAPINDPNQLPVDIAARANIVRFARQDGETRADWPTNARMEIHVPKSLTDTGDEPLTDCTALGCNDRTTYFSWSFTTTNKTDEDKPTLTSAYPRLPGSREGYPDRDVDRSITFILNFSEDIDFFTAVRADGRLNPENIKIEQVASGEPSAAVTAIIPAENFDVSASGTGLQFALNQSHQSSLNDGPYLEPYSWYRITAQNLTDLCGNPLSVTPVQWIFQTNGNIPGVAFTYPSDKYQFACPSTETFVQFRTSMYDIKRTSCAVSPTSGGLVVSGQGIAGRTLSVSDDKPPDQEGDPPVNPNNFCKRYDFAPASQALSVNTKYSPQVTYRNPKNDAQNENASWSFDVKPADQCANAPYISRLSPATGPWERCLTIQGNYFANSPGGDGRDTQRNGSDAFVKLNLGSGRNRIPLTAAAPGEDIRANWTDAAAYKNGLSLSVDNVNWFNTYLTDEMPNVAVIERADRVKLVPPGTDGIVDFNFFVVRKATLGGTVTPLASNLAAFAVPTTDPAYQGPCLFGLVPNVGQWETPVTLTGTKFGNFLPSRPTNNTWFTNEVAARITLPAVNWTETVIKTTVPDASTDGLVQVETPQGLSNGIYFDVAAGVGGSCRADNDCASGLICRGNRCVSPARPVGFRIEETNPAAACSAACTNAEVNLITNMAIKPTSASAAVFTGEARQSGALDIRECLSENCQSLGAHQTFIPRLALDDKKLIFGGFILVAGKRYRVIIYGGASGLAAADGDKQLANLNYDADGNGEKDSYSWHFTVGVNDCAVDRVDVAPSSLGLYEGGTSEDIWGSAYSQPDSCSVDGQALVLPAGDIGWRACQYTVGDITSECAAACPAPVADSSSIFQFNNYEGEPLRKGVAAIKGTAAGANGLACLFYQTSAIKDGAVVSVRSKCASDADCVGTDNSCPASVCNKTGANAGRCAPVINNFSPPNGAAGTWVSLNGCYFGNRAGTVKFNNTADFLAPGGACGSTWSDKQIIAEAPEGITGVGKLSVIKHQNQDGQTAVSASDFTVNETVYPGLCRLEPDYGKAGKEVNLYGKNFGASQASQGDAAKFENMSALIKSWSDDLLKAAVPQLNLTVEALKVAVTVLKAGIASNPKDFNALKSATGPGPVAPEDITVSSYMPGAGNSACLDMIVQVDFNGLLDGGATGLVLGQVASTTPNNFVARRAASVSPPAGGGEGGVGVAGEVWRDYPNNGSTTLSFIPDAPLAKSAQYQIVLKSGLTGLRSTTGGQLRAGGPCADLTGGQCVISFTTISGTAAENAQCAAAGLNIIPANPYFTCAGEGCEGDFQPTVAGHQRQFHATLEAKNGQPLAPRGANFSWQTSAVDVVTLLNPPDTGRVVTTTIGTKNGRSQVSAVMQGTEGPKQIEGASDVTVFLCKNPWPAINNENGLFFPYADSAGDRATNFSTYYCRDRGTTDTADDLPLFAGPVINVNRQGVPDLLKELFFTASSTKDAIGIRVLKNLSHYSTIEWYNRQSFNKGGPSPLTLDGYEALRDGRTVYANAANQSSTGELYTNIYLLSYNDGAQADTANIAKQMTENMSFAVNIIEPLDKDKLRRDVKRWTDALILSGALAAETAPPKLQSGTFIAGKSVSVWPSWQETLGRQLGGRLPIDPVATSTGANIVKCPAGYDQKTCFNKDLSPKFVCDAGSQAYFYRYAPSTANPPGPGSSILGFNLEYASPSAWVGLAEPWSAVTPRDDWCANLEYRRLYE